MRPEGAIAVQLPLVDRAPWTVITGRLAPANDDRPPRLRLGLDRLLAESSAAFASQRAKVLVLPAGTLRAERLPSLCTMAHRLGDHATSDYSLGRQRDGRLRPRRGVVRLHDRRRRLQPPPAADAA